MSDSIRFNFFKNMGINWRTRVPDDSDVAFFEMQSNTLQVFETPDRRIVAVKSLFPYSREAVHNVSDTELEKIGLFGPKTLTQRKVEFLKHEFAKWKTSNSK
jgi:hypothetical protein